MGVWIVYFAKGCCLALANSFVNPVERAHCESYHLLRLRSGYRFPSNPSITMMFLIILAVVFLGILNLSSLSIVVEFAYGIQLGFLHQRGLFLRIYFFLNEGEIT
jgi:hypothetical protein